MPSIPWSAVRLEIQVLVDGVEFEAVQFTSSFQVNTIPQCSITIAVGRDVRNTNRRAAIHDNFKLVRTRKPIKVFIKPKFLDASKADMPREWKDGLLFDGYITGIGWQRSTGGAQFIIHAEHWVSDFNYSSSLSGGSHPSNPSQFSYGAVFPPRALDDAGAGQPQIHPLIPSGTINVVTGSNIWEEVLKPWVKQVAEEDPIDPRLKAPDDPAKGNGLVLLQLDRIVTDKLTFDFDADDGQVIGDNISDYLSKHSFGQADFHQTMWAKLLAWASAFHFIVVPRPDEVLLVPQAAALKGDQWAHINTRDYVQCDINNSMGQIVRCVGVFHTVEYGAGTDTSPTNNTAPRIKDLAAVYPDPPKKGGIAIIIEPPGWLLDPVLAYGKSFSSTGTPKDKPTGTVFDPKDTGEDMEPKQDVAENVDKMERIMIQYAHHRYIIENLSGRYAEIAGRLRFDICPGSQVKLQAGGDPFIDNDDLAETYYAQVQRVTTLVNSELQQAGTSFTLAYVRTEDENDDDDFAVDKPPLYEEGWFGKELVDGYTPDK